MAEEPQHVNPDGKTDAEKGAKIGGIGGAVTGAVAGSAAGPVGTVVGAVVGGVAGAAASGAAVGAVDKHDGDDPAVVTTGDYVVARDTDYVDVNTPGNGIPGVQTGGHAVDGTADTRGIMEKTADAVTGDNIDDKTGKRVK
jgi:phage tail tape-measure protein